MTTPRAIAAGAVVGFYLLELSFSTAVQRWTAIAIIAAMYGFAVGYFPSMIAYNSTRRR